MNLRPLFLILIVAMSASALLSQSMLNYTTVRTTGNTYSSIASTGSAFNSWRSGAGAFQQDDNRSFQQDIGFDFWYHGVRYTSLSVSTNGFLDFSSSTDDGSSVADDFGYNNSTFFNSGAANGTFPAIAPFYDDLTAQGGTSALGGNILYQLSGTAPNRVFTVEWITMATYTNTTPNLNFQVKLYETTGVIEINYGTMNSGTHTFSYTMGMNGATLSNPPTATQLKALQTVNTNTFSNATAANLSAMPASGSRYTFTPPTPTAASGTLTFSAITQTGMTLNWSNWATNEVGYVIYNSTDGVNYNFITQTAANATNAAITGLTPGTTYQWRVMAVSEGALSSILTGTQTTLPAGNKISVTTGSWHTPGTWSPSGVPTAADNVTITSNHTVTISTGNAACNILTVGQGNSAMLQFNGNQIRTLSIGSTATVASNATLQTNAASAPTHTIIAVDNITNNGTINLNQGGGCNVIFAKAGDITVSGSGATTIFRNITLNMQGSVVRTVEFTTPTLTAASNFLSITNGLLKLSMSGASTLTPYTGNANIPYRSGIWLNAANTTVNMQGVSTFYGDLTVSAGTLNIGNAINEDLVCNGALVTVSGGTLNIAGKFYSSGINNVARFTLSGGAVNLATVGTSVTTIAPFNMVGTGSVFNMSGGTMTIVREGGSGAENLGYVNTGSTMGSVTGGTLQIGNTSTPAGQTMQVNTSFPVGNIHVNSANATALLLTNPITVIQNVTVTTGILNANNLDITLGGNWSNTGGTFTPGLGTVTFNGTAAQTIFKTGGETFNNLIFSNAGTKTQLSNITATGNITVNAGSGTLSGNNFNITVAGNWSNGSTYTAGTGTVLFNGTLAQTIQRTGGETFNHLSFSNAGTKSFLSDITATGNVLINAGSGGITANNFNTTVGGNWTNNGALFTPGTSTTTFNGTIAQTIFKSGGETFGSLVFTNSGAKSLLSPISASGSFTIDSGTSLDVSTSNHQVTIGGNYSNSGTFTTQRGSVLLNGTAAQTIGGSTITNFYNLTLNNTAGASLLTAQNLQGALTLSNGTFNINGQTFTMLSNATMTARIAPITGTGDITGNVVVQRYAPGGSTGWTFWGTPLTSALTFADWNDDFAITCASCPNGYPGSFTSIYSYDETQPGTFDAYTAYIPISNISNPITAGKGYWVYLGNGQTTTTAITADVTGSVRKFNYSIPLSYTNTGSAVDDGWNLISNPYPSPIKWTFLRGATANIDNAIYVYNPDLSGGAGSYATYVNGISSPSAGSGGITDTIPMSQAFYVHSTGATSLSATETNKVSGNPTFLKMTATPQSTASIPLLRLKLTGGTYADETVLYEQAGATDFFDSDYDAIKMLGMDPNAPYIALFNANQLYQVNGVAPIQNAWTMPLKTITGYSGTYTISAHDFAFFQPGVCLSLYDRFTGITTDLRASTYTFTLLDTTSVARFDLNITSNPLSITSSVQQPTCSNAQAVIVASGNSSGPWNFVWSDNNGNIIKSTTNSLAADTLFNITSGVYNVQVNTAGSCDAGTEQFIINAVEIPVADFQCPDTIYLSQGGNISFQNMSSYSANWEWNFGDGNTSLMSDPTHTYSSNGNYLVQLIATSSTSCSDTTEKTVVVESITLGIESSVTNSIQVFSAEHSILIKNKLNTELQEAKIYDASGRLVRTERLQNSTLYTINCENLSSGVYLLHIVTRDAKVFSYRVFIQ